MQPLRKRRRRTLASADEEQEARLLGAPAPFDGSSSEDEGPVYLGAALASVDAAEHDEALLHVEPEGDGRTLTPKNIFPRTQSENALLGTGVQIP